jgi:hypothetical protein
MPILESSGLDTEKRSEGSVFQQSKIYYLSSGFANCSANFPGVHVDQLFFSDTGTHKAFFLLHDALTLQAWFLNRAP